MLKSSRVRHKGVWLRKLDQLLVEAYGAGIFDTRPPNVLSTQDHGECPHWDREILDDEGLEVDIVVKIDLVQGTLPDGRKLLIGRCPECGKYYWRWD